MITNPSKSTSKLITQNEITGDQEYESSKEYVVKCNEELVLNLVIAIFYNHGIELPYLKF